MLKNDYQCSLVIYNEAGDGLGETPVKVDWDPASEWVRFQALRQGKLGVDEMNAPTVFEPLYDSKLGEPFLRAFRIKVQSKDGKSCFKEFGNTYFQSMAHSISAAYVEKGLLQEREVFHYAVVAYPQKPEDGTSSGISFEIEEVSQSLPILESSLREFGRVRILSGAVDDEDMPVFIPQDVLNEATELTRQAEEKETGGILLGNLYRDQEVGELFAVVTAQIPAKHTQSESAKLTFTAETWTAAQTALDLRQSNELMLGWWHSHPQKEWCKECPPDKRKNCVLLKGFFSGDDRHLHRAVFPRAYSLALVVTHTLEGLSHKLFGWKAGGIESRGFYIAQAEELTPNRPVLIGGKEGKRYASVK